MSKAIYFNFNSKRFQEYLKSMELVLHELKSENINDRFYTKMKNSDIYKPIDIFNDDYNNFSPIGSTKYLKQKYNYFRTSNNKKLEDLELNDLIAKLYTYRDDQVEYRKILFLIKKKRFTLWLEKIISKLKKILKLLDNNIKIKIQNKREFFRKIYCFFFKNLDDTHSTIIFN